MPASEQDLISAAPLVENNKHIQGLLAAENARHADRIAELTKQIKPPCQFCPYDGVHRCSACAAHCYAGYNKKDFFDELYLGKSLSVGDHRNDDSLLEYGF